MVAETAGARVRAGAAVLASTPPPAGVRPLRSRLSVTSSHIVLTEPVPDVLEQIGWTGGESITDGAHVRALLPHDAGRADRCSAGAAAGWLRRPAQRPVEVDPRRRGDRTRTCRHVPGARRPPITHAWGGPIDVSPSHLPQIGTLDDGPVHYVFGFTGNGVGPSHLAGRVLAGARARDGDRTLALVDPAPVRVPPEPLAWVGGHARARGDPARRAAYRPPAGAPDPLTRAVARRAAGARDPRVAINAGRHARPAGIRPAAIIASSSPRKPGVDLPAVQVGTAHRRADVEPRRERGGHPQ